MADTKTKKSRSNTVCRNVSLARDTDRALGEIKAGLSRVVPGLKPVHSYTFACEQAIHYCYNQIMTGHLSYKELFTIPHGAEEGEEEEEAVELESGI